MVKQDFIKVLKYCQYIRQTDSLYIIYKQEQIIMKNEQRKSTAWKLKIQLLIFSFSFYRKLTKLKKNPKQKRKRQPLSNKGKVWILTVLPEALG